MTKVSVFRFQLLCFFFLTPACHAVAQQSVGGTPETLRFVLLTPTLRAGSRFRNADVG